MKGFILAAGMGKRLRPLTLKIPKPMIKVGGKPIMQHLVELLHSYGYDVMANVHYLPEQIVKHFSGDILFSYEKELLGTAGAIAKVGRWLGEDFVVMNADTLTNINLNDMMKSHKGSGCIATIFTKDTATHNGGTIIFSKRVLDYIPPTGAYSIEHDLTPDLIKRGIPINLYRSDAYYFDTANVEKLEKARKYYREMKVGI